MNHLVQECFLFKAKPRPNQQKRGESLPNFFGDCALCTMPKLDAAQKKEALEHVIIELFDQPLDGQLHISLKQKGINDPNGICHLTERQLENLQCMETNEDGDIVKDKNGKPVLKTLCGMFAAHLIHFKRCVRFLTDNQTPVLNKWKEMSCDDFESWRTSKYNSDAPPPTPAEVTAQEQNTLNQSILQHKSRQMDNVTAFKKGIKRDTSVYPILKDDSKFRAWNRQLVIQARAQDVDVVLDNPQHQSRRHCL